MNNQELPKAFQRKLSEEAPALYAHSYAESRIWADTYNSVLDATNAKLLYEAAVHCEKILSVTEPHSEMVNKLRIALGK